jgi:biopolymer transport protein ExbD
MVDIMFLLLLFFMLGADMGRREMEELKLPIAEMAKEEPKEHVEGEVRTTINVFHVSEDEIACADYAGGGYCRNEKDHWKIAIRGQHYDAKSVVPQLKAEADESLEDEIDPVAQKRLSKRKAIVRADQRAPYGLVLNVIETCGSVGIYKVELGAAKPSADE